MTNGHGSPPMQWQQPPKRLPLPQLATAADTAVLMECAVSPIGAKGRISDAFCLRALGWVAGTLVTVQATIGVVTVSPVVRRRRPDSAWTPAVTFACCHWISVLQALSQDSAF